MGRLLILCVFFLPALSFASSSSKDIVLDDMVISGETSVSRGAIIADLQPWEDGVLPLVFASGFTAAQKQQVFTACSKWSAVASVRCMEGTYKGRTLKVTNSSSSCFALWGMGTYFGGAKRRMNLGANCMRSHIILHELGHAFGLIHEHQRMDRDDFLQIFPKNVQAGFLGLQLKVNFNPQNSVNKTPYDFMSVMHYARSAFSKNGGDTMLPKAEYMEFADKMGHTTELSPGDIVTIRSVYGI
jgi:hypothetical protein